MDGAYGHDQPTYKTSASEDDSGHSEGLNDNLSLMSDQSEEMVFSDEMLFEDCENSEQDATPGSPMTNVLVRLDSLLREKINSEVEEFQENLHEVLNQHFHIERKLMKLSKPPKDVSSEDECGRTSFNLCADTSGNFSVPEPLMTKSIEDDIDSERNTDNEKNQKLIELFTSASVISSTLRRPEFTT